MKSRIRKFLFPVCLLLLNAGGLWQGLRMWESYLQEKTVDPRVIFSPADLEMLSEKQAVMWRWSQPVVHPSQLGEVDGEAPINIDPPVAGLYRWTSEQELTFTPLVDWPVARPLTFEVQALATNAQQRVFALNHISKTVGPPLEVVAADPFLLSETEEVQIRLRLNAPVDMTTLRKHLRVLDKEDRAMDFSLQETPQPDEFLISTSWPGQEAFTLLVQSGLSPVFGDEGAMVRERSFSIKKVEQFTLTGFDVSQPTFGQAEIDISFSNIPSLQSVRDGLQIEPPVDFSVGQGRWWRRQSCQVTGDFEPGKRYRFRFLEGIRSQNGPVLKKTVEREVIIPARKPGLKFAHDGWILNAGGATEVEVLTENEGSLEIQVDRVYANNLVAYAVRASGQDGWSSEKHPERTLSDRVLERRVEAVDHGATILELSELLENSGQGIFRLRVKGRNSGRQIDKIIALSDVGMLARRTGNELLVWALRLDSAEPVADFEITLWSDTRQLLARGMTSEEGVCTLSWEEDSKGSPLVVLGEKNSSLGLLRLVDEQPFPGQNGERPYVQEGNEAFVYTERGMYRPEETVNVRAIVRGKNFSLPGRFPVVARMVDSAGLTVWEKQIPLSDVGTAEAEIKIQAEWKNGPYHIRFSLPGEDAPLWGSTRVYVESFAPPQVVVDAYTPGNPDSVPETFTVQVDARMLYGGPAASHKGKAVLTLLPDTFRSSEYPDHVFSDARKTGFGQWSRPLGELVTDQNGGAELLVRVPEEKTGPSTVRAVIGISVNEFSGREASTFVSRRVDRVPYYVGLKVSKHSERTLSLHLAGVKPDGSPYSENADLELTWYRVNWQSGYRRDSRGRFTWFSNEVDVREGSRKLRMENGSLSEDLDLSSDGVYRVAVRDLKTGFSCSQKISVGNSGGEPDRADRVKLQLDKEHYLPGEEALLTLNAPFAGRVLLTLESDELLWHQTMEMKQRKAQVTWRVPETGAANLWVRASLVRPQPGGGAAPVLRSEGVCPLRLTSGSRERGLEIQVAKSLLPSEPVELRIVGEPGAEVLVAGVDEGILLLSDFQTPNPLSWFLALRRAISVSWDSFDEILPERGRGFFAGNAKMGGGEGLAIRKRLNPVDAKRFKPLSWWSGAQRIPESGELVLTMPMPEFSGTVRWMAVQVSEGGMGHAEAFSTVGRTLIVQQSVPLFLAPGDETQWTIRLHNRSTEEKTVTLKPTTRGPVEFEGAGEIIPLEAGEVLLREITLNATEQIGKAEVVLGIKTGEAFWQDRLELAVRPLEAFEERADRFVIAPGEERTIDPMERMVEGTGRRFLQVSSMPAVQVGAADRFLLRYPYGCVEQTVSAAAPALYMADWAEGSGEGASQRIQTAIMELWKKQKRDGSFGYWDAGDQTSVSGSFGAMAFLLEAKEQGYRVHEPFLQAGIDWTREWLLAENWSGNSRKNFQRTQACRVLAMAGELDAGWMQRLRVRKKDLEGYARVMAAEAMMYGGQRRLALEMLEGIDRVDQGWGWQSSVSGNAELLWVLLMLNPQDGRIVPLVDGLLSKKNKQGRWSQTYENAQVIRALVKYAKVWPVEDGEMRVRWQEAGKPGHWLGEDRLVKVADASGGVLRNHGPQPVYVELQTEGIPLTSAPVKNTFKVERSLLHLNGRVVSDNEKLESGETFMMRFTISQLPRRVEYLALDQRLPAGLEAFPISRQQQPWKQMQRKPKYEVSRPRHLEVRDDRILLFPGTIGPRERNFYVLVRAVSPGRYRFPAVFAQDMYEDLLIFRGVDSGLEVTR